MRATSPELPPPTDLPGLKRHQVVEFRTSVWPDIRAWIDHFSGGTSRIVSLSVRSVDGGYVARATLEGAGESQMRSFLDCLSSVQELTVETLYYSAAGAPGTPGVGA